MKRRVDDIATLLWILLLVFVVGWVAYTILGSMAVTEKILKPRSK